MKFINIILLSSVFTGLFYGTSTYTGSTTAAVTLAGAILNAKHDINIEKKYKRKDCPVCKGKGWYMSGDDIQKITCEYCEPETESIPSNPVVENPISSQNPPRTIIRRR